MDSMKMVQYVCTIWCGLSCRQCVNIYVPWGSKFLGFKCNKCLVLLQLFVCDFRAVTILSVCTSNVHKACWGVFATVMVDKKTIAFYLCVSDQFHTSIAQRRRCTTQTKRCRHTWVRWCRWQQRLVSQCVGLAAIYLLWDSNWLCHLTL